MRVITYGSIKEFEEDNKIDLLKKESLNQLILHNIKVRQDKKAEGNLVFGKVIDEKDNKQLIFLNAIPFDFLICSLTDNMESVRILSKYLVENKINIKGLNSTHDVCTEFIKNYEAMMPVKFQKSLGMDIMELRELKDLRLPKGFFRVAEEKDFNQIFNFSLKFSDEATNDVEDKEELKKKLTYRINNGHICVFEDVNHNIVSMAAMTRQLENGVSVSMVYTDINERGKGYGKAVVYNLSKRYLEMGNKFCTLYVDKTNPISNKIYKEIGYEILQDSYDYRVCTGDEK